MRLPLSRIIQECRFAAIDFESAGAAPGEPDQPVQIGIALIGGWQEKPLLWESYIATNKPVLWSASKVHGITTDMLAGAPSFLSLWNTIRTYLEGAVVIGHNPATERRFLRHFPGHGFGPWIDTLALARMCLPGLPDYSLRSVADALGVSDSLAALLPGKTWHNALFDAAASLFIFQVIVRELHLEESPLDTLGAAIKQ